MLFLCCTSGLFYPSVYIFLTLQLCLLGAFAFKQKAFRRLKPIQKERNSFLHKRFRKELDASLKYVFLRVPT